MYTSCIYHIYYTIMTTGPAQAECVVEEARRYRVHQIPIEAQTGEMSETTQGDQRGRRESVIAC